jgi:hypothetical protein
VDMEIEGKVAGEELNNKMLKSESETSAVAC